MALRSGGHLSFIEMEKETFKLESNKLEPALFYCFTFYVFGGKTSLFTLICLLVSALLGYPSY